MTIMHDIILVNPPYGTMGNPYIAVPALHGFLKKEGIRVFSRDMNALLFKDLSKPAQVRRGIAHAKKRFSILNAKAQLNFAESIEYKTFATLLFQLSCHGRALTDFIDSEYSFHDFRCVPFNKLLITASTAPDFPEIILTTPQFAVNPLSECFSVSGIMESLKEENKSMDAVYRIIDDTMASHDSPIWGISVTFQEQIIKAFQCAAYIKRKKPDAVVIMGGASIGAYFHNFPDNRLFSLADVFAYHEGEHTLKALVNAVKNNRHFSEVPGIAYVDQGRIRRTDPPPPIPINESIVPDYRSMDLDDYLTERMRMTVPIRLTRGCAWGRCTFCSSFHSKYEEIDPDRAFDHLLTVYQDTGIRNFMFSDEAAPLKTLDRLSEKIIEKKLPISWTFHTRVTGKLSRKRCERYKQAGCCRVYVGIESTSDRILKKMDKGITFDVIDSFFQTIDGAIPIMAYMMIGFPGESEEEAKKGFQYLNNLVEQKKLTSYVYSHFTVKPDSAIWEHPETFGIKALSSRNDLDLDHNGYCSAKEGMTLETAYTHYCTYSGKSEFDRICSKIKTIQFQELDAPLHFSMADVSDFVSSHTEFFYQPIREWFSNPAILQRATIFSW